MFSWVVTVGSLRVDFRVEASLEVGERGVGGWMDVSIWLLWIVMLM